MEEKNGRGKEKEGSRKEVESGTDKNFLTISKKECLSAYKTILLNSDNHWEAGKKLAESSLYGYAISHEIISIEEFIKAIIVFLDGMGFDFRKVKGMNSFFKDHQIRYLLAYALFALAVFGEDLKAFILSANENPEKAMLLFMDMKNNDSRVEKRMQYYALRKFIQLRSEFEWFSKVDLFRQDGAYCDFKGNMKTPLNMSHDDYLNVYTRLEKVRSVGVAIFHSFELPLYVKQMKEIQREMKTRNHYAKISEGLFKIRQSKDGPFEHIRKNIITTE